MTAIDPTLRATKTTCPYCGVGCGVLATPDGNGGAAIAGDPDHPANFGRLCSKGSALGETVGLESRLLYPMIRCKGVLERVAWSDALDHVAHRMQHIVARDGADAVAFYLSGQLLTEDYYVANKLMKGFLGTANVDTNSRLCMSSSVAGHRRAFGADTVPGCYEDLEQADLLVFVGSNAAWCHPVLFQRMLKPRKRARRAMIVVIDPRRTDTATTPISSSASSPAPTRRCSPACSSISPQWRAGSGLHRAAHVGLRRRAGARAQHRAADRRDRAGDRPAEQDVATFFKMFRDTERVVTLYSQGVNQSAPGTDKVNAILNSIRDASASRRRKSALSTAISPRAASASRAPRRSRSPASPTRWAAARSAASPTSSPRIWISRRPTSTACGGSGRRRASPPMKGLKAVQLFEAINRGEVKALWVMGTNPAVSLPDADVVREALKKLELFVVSENVLSNDTVDAGPHVLLPALAWGEKSGTVTNSERRISRQRVVPAGAGRGAAGLVDPERDRKAPRLRRQLRLQIRRPTFSASMPRFRLSRTMAARDFDIGALTSLSDEAFDALKPVHGRAREGEAAGERFFANGGFFTNDGKGRFVAPEVPALRGETGPSRPLRLNTGRIRDQWHTMTRTGLSQRLGAHLPEPFVEIHPDDASKHGIAHDGYARITTDYGQCILKVVVSDRQQRGTLFAPIHWSAMNASHGRVGALVQSFTDPFSGQPESKATPAAISPYEYVFRGFALSRKQLDLPPNLMWTRVTVTGGFGYLFADNADLSRWPAWLDGVAGEDVADYRDFGGGVYRAASFAGDRIETCLFVGPAHDAGDWEVVKSLFVADHVTDEQRRMLLSGKSTEGAASTGPIVCACFGVGRGTICDTIASGARTAAEIGAKLKAGTNCGSCIPELKRLIATTEVAPAKQAKVAAAAG